MTALRWLVLVLIGSFPASLGMPWSRADTPVASYGESLVPLPTTTDNQVLWQQYQALQTGTPISNCSACGEHAPGYDRCGCNTALFSWHDGPGNCDQWCVGPRWQVDASGLMLYRDEFDWNRITAIVTTPGLQATPSLEDPFDHGLGARIFATAYNDSGFGIQIGYEGGNQWDATSVFSPIDPAVDPTRRFEYESRLNSVEVNFLPHVPHAWKLFGGFRYVQLNEDFADFTTNVKPIPPPADPAAAPTAVVDSGIAHLLINRLFGFQMGARRDAWNWGNRLTIQSFANAGVYCNKFRRDDITRTVTTITAGDDLSTPTVDEFSQTTSSVQSTSQFDLADVAFVGEAGIVSLLRLNPCVALRTGYQVLAVDGVGQGIDAFFTPGINADTVVYHGLQFGIEYRR